jgi:hypothetical protein
MFDGLIDVTLAALGPMVLSGPTLDESTVTFQMCNRFPAPEN